jgi:hypothetical protein
MRTHMRLVRSVALAAVVAMALGIFGARATIASAQTVLCDPATNHCYEVVAVSAGITWPNAKAAAEAKTYNGFPGHLVTITSQAETNFLVASGLTPAAYWIGGSQPPGQTGAATNWSWVTGESFIYTNWSAGEPNDFYGPASEQYLEFWSPAGTWNDENNTFMQPGYVVEYDRPLDFDDCKKDGWMAYSIFKNQGDCVSWIATVGKNEPANMP